MSFDFEDFNGDSGWRQIKVRYATTCPSCGGRVAPGTTALFNVTSRRDASSPRSQYNRGSAKGEQVNEQRLQTMRKGFDLHMMSDPLTREFTCDLCGESATYIDVVRVDRTRAEMTVGIEFKCERHNSVGYWFTLEDWFAEEDAEPGSYRHFHDTKVWGPIVAELVDSRQMSEATWRREEAK
jgi:hypothetical protein